MCILLSSLKQMLCYSLLNHLCTLKVTSDFLFYISGTLQNILGTFQKMALLFQTMTFLLIVCNYGNTFQFAKYPILFTSKTGSFQSPL